MTDRGDIITFYSYKGGVGRSMAVANVGLTLAQWGHSVLLVDLDLEAPGLQYFFQKYASVSLINKAPGILELLTTLPQLSAGHIGDRIEGMPIHVKTPRGAIYLLPAGARTSTYIRRVRELDLREMYATSDAGNAVERLRNALKARFDFVLIDSRTGNTEIGGLSTVQLPDVIVLLFTPTEQGVVGAKNIVTLAAAARQRLPVSRPQVPILPLPCRIETSSEFRLSQQWFERIARTFSYEFDAWLPISVNPRSFVETMKLPQISYFGFGEPLPIIEQGTSDPAGLGYAYESLAALLAQRLQNVEIFVHDRSAYIARAADRRVEPTVGDQKRTIFLSYSQSDQEWAERIRMFLQPLVRSGDLEVVDHTGVAVGQEWTNEIRNAIERAAIVLILVSADYLASDELSAVELPAVLRSAEERGTRIMVLPVRPSHWQASPLGSYQSAWTASKTLSELPPPEVDRTLTRLSEQIAALLSPS